MRRSWRDVVLIALSALFVLPIVACGDPAEAPVKERRSSWSSAGDACSATKVSYLKNMKRVEQDSDDPIVSVAWGAAADAAGEQRDRFVAEYCSMEILSSPDHVRCFHFLSKQPSVGGAVKLCVDGARKVSRLHLDE